MTLVGFTIETGSGSCFKFKAEGLRNITLHRVSLSHFCFRVFLILGTMQPHDGKLTHIGCKECVFNSNYIAVSNVSYGAQIGEYITGSIWLGDLVFQRCVSGGCVLACNAGS